MHQRLRRSSILGVVGLCLLAAAGCPSVDPGPLKPELLNEEVGYLLDIACHFSAPARDDHLDLQRRVRRNFEESLVRAFSLHEVNNVLTAVKTVVNHPGLLQKLEVNRFLAAFVLACGEDVRVTFFREDDLVRTESFAGGAARRLRKTGVLDLDLRSQAFNIHEDVTPQIYTFSRHAIEVPLAKVKLGFKPEASRITLSIRDEALIRNMRARLGWTEEEEPSLASSETFAERISRERRVYAVVAGIVLIEDVIRPGAQVVVDDRGARWVFGGFVRERDRTWAEALFQRNEGRRIERYVIRRRRADEEPIEPSPATPSSAPPISRESTPSSSTPEAPRPESPPASPRAESSATSGPESKRDG